MPDTHYSAREMLDPATTEIIAAQIIDDRLSRVGDIICSALLLPVDEDTECPATDHPVLAAELATIAEHGDEHTAVAARAILAELGWQQPSTISEDL